MKKAFLTGLAILLPIALTAYIVVWLFDFLTDPFIGFVEHFVIAYEATRGIDIRHHDLLVAIFSRIIVLAILALLILLLGFLGRKWLAALAHKILIKIPVVKSIYGILSEVAKAFLKPGQRAFKGTVLIPFPHKNTHALGLITGETPEGLRRVIADANITVFIPTAPHPISGYVLFAPRNQLIDVPITTEETFSFLISCGMTLPSEDL